MAKEPSPSDKKWWKENPGRYDLLDKLVGQTVKEVRREVECDEGFVLTFESGSELSVSYSSCEGRSKIDGEAIDV